MNADRAQIYLEEVKRQRQFALLAVDDMQLALSADNTTRLWFAIQNLLIAVGNISKLLWPSVKGAKSRGESLRAALQIEDDSPLASRQFRNHFEHFDERLDSWGVSPHTHLVMDSNIGPASASSGGSAMARLRHFDPSTIAVAYDAEVYELRPVIDALQNLGQ